MSEHENKKVLLSLKNVDVKFNVRGRILSAIRNVSLDIYENESIAIVGESGSGKSVLTKTFAGMLDSNGYISNGSIIFSDDEISKTCVKLEKTNKMFYNFVLNQLNKYSPLERGAKEYCEIRRLKEELQALKGLSEEEEEKFEVKLKEVNDNITDTKNYILTLDKNNAEDKVELIKANEKLEKYYTKQKEILDKKNSVIAERKEKIEKDVEYVNNFNNKIASLETERAIKIATNDVDESKGNPFNLSDEVVARNELIAKEIILSVGRYPFHSKFKFVYKLMKAFKKAMTEGLDLTDKEILNKIFDVAVFRVEYRNTLEDGTIEGYAIIDCAKVKYTNDWQQIRGCRIATVFQDPMTSLNPIITIGKQIMTVILKHQKCSYAEAKQRALDIMSKVGIPNPKKRFNDYPFQYSGGMRQRIVIAIALSCQPKILICDEPTTALDVTIQAQIIRLIKDLQKQLGFTTVYITHDLGVVANVAERVAVLYGGQIVEYGMVDEIFYDPRHPYTWALLSSLPQLCEKGEDLFSIPGTPPSLYNKIVGDSFAPRNKYVMAIDLVKEPPMFKVSETHYAKTWLLDPRAPKMEKPKNIQNLHEKMKASFKNII